MSDLLPLFVNLAGRRVVLVGGGPVAWAKLPQLLAAGADVRVVAPEVHPEIVAAGVPIDRRAFTAADLDGAWFVVAAATPEVNREVAAAAESRRILVNAVDDPPNATAYLGGVVRRDGLTLAISTSGDAPGLTALLRQALDAVLPDDIGDWMNEARRLRAGWRRDRVPMADRRPLLLAALNRLYSVRSGLSRTNSDPPVEEHSRRRRKGRGFVSIVGAGPGDPDLLTRRAASRLRHADLVLYDALVDERLLRLSRRAQRFFVGKRAGRQALAQHEINAVMINAARRGRAVVRLKGGDPFVFGRGGEEALALVEAGVPFDVVPGLTSAVAAPALAGIPMTHRGAAAGFIVLSGHDDEAFDATIAQLPARAWERMTIVVLMGLATQSAWAARLIERGWERRTPAALVIGASTAAQQVWRGTLDDLATAGVLANRDGDDGPGVFVIGAVAGLSLVGRVHASAAEEHHGFNRHIN